MYLLQIVVMWNNLYIQLLPPRTMANQVIDSSTHPIVEYLIRRQATRCHVYSLFPEG